MYYFVVCAVKGKYSQTVLTEGSSVSLVDSDLHAPHRIRVVNENAMLVMVRKFLRQETVAGVTIRKVVGVIQPLLGEREIMLRLPNEGLP